MECNIKKKFHCASIVSMMNRYTAPKSLKWHKEIVGYFWTCNKVTKLYNQIWEVSWAKFFTKQVCEYLNRRSYITSKVSLYFKLKSYKIEWSQFGRREIVIGTRLTWPHKEKSPYFQEYIYWILTCLIYRWNKIYYPDGGEKMSLSRRMIYNLLFLLVFFEDKLCCLY